MANKPSSKKNAKGQGGSRYAALTLLAIILLAVAGYLFFNPDNPVEPPVIKNVLPQPPVSRPKPPQPTETVIPVQPHKTAPSPPAQPVQPVQPGTYPDIKKHEDKVTEVRVVPAGRGGLLAIIIDDMGNSMQEATSLKSIGVPLTFSIIPGLQKYREVAAYASAQGIETMLHIPMQSKGWPERRLESNGLLVSTADADIQARLDEFLRDIPKAVGANNHMGSEFTEHADKMRIVLGKLNDSKLFFVDSVTTPNTTGLLIAKELGLKSARRNVFLDNEQNEIYIRGQLNQAVKQARKTGGAIAICHPHQATIKTLSLVLPTLEKQGVTLVPASRLVR